MMNSYKHYLSSVIISALLLLQGCAGTPVSIGVSKDFDRSLYDMDNPKQATVTASGLQLLYFIPININSRHARAYSMIETQAEDGLVSDIQIQESWVYAFAGTVYKTTMKANIYPRIRLQQVKQAEGHNQRPVLKANTSKGNFWSE